ADVGVAAVKIQVVSAPEILLASFALMKGEAHPRAGDRVVGVTGPREEIGRSAWICGDTRTGDEHLAEHRARGHHTGGAADLVHLERAPEVALRTETAHVVHAEDDAVAHATAVARAPA